MTATLTEYVCEDCGTLLRHSNPNTLESMRDVHNQLCIVKRQKTMAAQVAVPKPAAAPAAAAATPAAASPPPAIPATPSGSAAGGSTTISLSGTGTSYGKVEGPIDPKFKEKRQQVGTFQGIKVWGPYDAP
ncbi:MAG TPA: hypothetical protein VGQ13_04930, partial [Nitrososphaera sp.]|nr:hypothetical protein [Nitrososphaera sp.]